MTTRRCAVQADQAQGLRRRAVVTRLVSVFAGDDGVAHRLAGALQAQRLRVVLVDTRPPATQAVRFLGDWRQRLGGHARMIVSIAGIDCFHAPGACAGEAQIVAALRDYDILVFASDAAHAGTRLPDPAHRQSLVVEPGSNAAALADAYALLKTLAQTRLAWPVYLCGEHAAGALVQQAVQRFLPRSFSAGVHLAQADVTHLTALAAKIAADTPGADRTDNYTGVQQTHG
jgi:hypothetical protein